MNFIARVDDSHREKIREIAGSLETLGVKVREVLTAVGVITGSSETLSLEQLKIEGIATVEVDRKWGAGMPEVEQEAGKARMAKGKGERGTEPIKDAPKAEEKHVVAKRSGGKAKRKD